MATNAADTAWRERVLALAVLASLAAAAAVLLVLAEDLTREQIIANERARRLEQLTTVLPVAYDNDLLDDTVQVVDGDLLGSSEPQTVYRARRDGEPAGVIMEVVAPAGYGGPIELRVGVYPDGRIAGVRVTSHHETPGLGDGIEAGQSDWITRFAGRSLESPPSEQWTVKRDGGTFDQFTGATITPRAVVKAVHDALIYFRLHREELLASNDDSPQ